MAFIIGKIEIFIQIICTIKEFQISKTQTKDRSCQLTSLMHYSFLMPNFIRQKKNYCSHSGWQTGLFPTKEINLNPTKFN